MKQPTDAACDGAGHSPAPSGSAAPRQTRALHTCKQLAVLVAQLVLIVGVYAAGCALAHVLPIALPGNIVGMVLLLALLGTGLLKAKHVGRACDCLLDNMSLFFIPAGVAIMGCVSLLEGNALKFAFVCVVTTVMVFLATSYTVVLVSRLMAHRGKSTCASTPAQALVDEEV